jgi:DNA-binding IclR family transcriptional regulator
LTDPGERSGELDRTQTLGHAIEDHEFRTGLRALAPPVTSAEGDVLVALALSTRRDRTILFAHQDAVTAAATARSSQLA